MLPDKIHHLFPGNVLPVGFDSFPKILVMRTHIKPRFHARSLTNRGQHMAHRALAIRARHMYGTEFMLRISQVLAEREGVVEAVLVGGGPNTVIHGQLGIKELQRLFIIHRISALLRKMKDPSVCLKNLAANFGLIRTFAHINHIVPIDHIVHLKKICIQ